MKGFSIIEAILTLSILSAGVLGVMSLYQKNIAQSNETETTLIATALAQEKLEQILHDKKYQEYIFIIAANYPTSEDLTPIGYPGYTRTIAIQEVSGTDLSSAQSGTGYKKITVAVQSAGNPTITLETLVTAWGEL